MVALAQTHGTPDDGFRAQRVALKRGPDGQPLRAAGAVRISEDRQSEHSEQTQREAVMARAHADGYLMDAGDIFIDHARGHTLTRKGYVAVLKGVRERRYAAVYVFMLDRWGRDSIERQQRGKELDTLGVPVISVLEGVDEPGLVRVIRAELSEEESRKNALRVTPNRERAARGGQHMGSTPFGYRRIYPAWDGTGRRPAGALTPREPQAGIVRELFERYASGQQSTRQLAEDLNKRGVPSPRSTPPQIAPDGTVIAPGRQYAWATGTIHDILSNVTYTGQVGYNQHPTGHYQKATQGSAFTADGKHAPLVSLDVFAAVQRRLADARTYQSVARRRPHIHVVAGLLRCATCGGLMVPMLPVEGSTVNGAMRCANRHHGAGCTGQGYRLDLATAALMAEVSRLRGHPWTTEAEQRLRGDDAQAMSALDHELADAKAALKSYTRQVMMRAEPPTPEQQAIFDEVSREQSAHIASLTARLAEMTGDAAALPKLRALHQRLSQTEVGSLVQRLQAAGDTVSLRDLVTGLVESATLVERRPATRSTWLRFAVTWQPDVQRLLDAGLLALAPAAEPPAK